MSVASRREQPQAATYSKRLKDSIKSILDNYGEILKASKVNIFSNYEDVNLTLQINITGPYVNLIEYCHHRSVTRHSV